MVRTAAGGTDALCRDDRGREETVATELVGPVGAGDRLLVHAGVAIEVIETAELVEAVEAIEAIEAGGTGGTAGREAPTPIPIPTDDRTQTGDRDAVRR